MNIEDDVYTIVCLDHGWTYDPPPIYHIYHSSQWVNLTWAQIHVYSWPVNLQNHMDEWRELIMKLIVVIFFS